MNLHFSPSQVSKMVEFEGLYQRLYNDPSGNCTVGIGHLVHYGPIDGQSSEARWAGRTVPIAECYALFLVEDCPQYEKQVNDWANRWQITLTQNQFDALFFFVFNLGSGPLVNGTLGQRLKQGDFFGAADAILLYDKAVYKGSLQTLSGLTKRRKYERALFLSPDSITPTPKRKALPQMFISGIGDGNLWLITSTGRAVLQSGATVTALRKIGIEQTDTECPELKALPVLNTGVPVKVI